MRVDSRRATLDGPSWTYHIARSALYRTARTTARSGRRAVSCPLCLLCSSHPCACTTVHADAHYNTPTPSILSAYFPASPNLVWCIIPPLFPCGIQTCFEGDLQSEDRTSLLYTSLSRSWSSARFLVESVTNVELVSAVAYCIIGGERSSYKIHG